MKLRKADRASQSRNQKSSGEMTAETLEQMFVYLGCANIPTQEAMDGAIPLESIISCGGSGGFAACFTPGEIAEMSPVWSTKAVWFSGEHLGLSTVENIHWSAISHELAWHRSFLNAGGSGVSMRQLTANSDGYVRLHYSEIDRYGRFLKFPVRSKARGALVVKKTFNPNWLFEFRDGHMSCVASESDATLADKRLTFLAPFLCGVAQSVGCYWLVKTRFDEVCPSLTLLTDPTGVKEFWRLRDVPPGRSRRSALLHWVEQHWRQTRKDPDVEAFVRKHLRGETVVKHGKLEAVISPSVRDSIEAEKAKESRELLSKLKADRRKRRRLLK